MQSISKYCVMLSCFLFGGKVSVLVARNVNFARHLNSFQGMMKIHCHSWFDLLPFS